jgi:hypothetical protein
MQSDGGRCASVLLMPRNLLLVGDLLARFRAVQDGSAKAVWFDWRTLLKANSDAKQLSLFESIERCDSEAAFGEYAEAAVTEWWRVLEDDGHLFVLSDARVSHHVRGIIDKVFTADQFRIEMPVALRKGSPPHGASSNVVIVYARSSRAVLKGSSRDTGALDRVYRYSDAETGRRYTLAACVRPYLDDARFNYEWNGFRRTWRWTRQELDSLLAQGRIVTTRSGLPRLKRYYDEASRRAPSWASPWLKAGLVADAPDAMFAKLLVEAALEQGDILIDASLKGTSLIEAAKAASCTWIGIARDHQHAAIFRNALRRRPELETNYVLAQPASAREASALAAINPREFKYWVLGALGAQFSAHQSSVGLHQGYLSLPSLQTTIPVFVDASKISVANLRFAQKTRRAERAPIAVVVSPESSSRLRTLEQASARDVVFVPIQQLLSTSQQELIRELERRLRERRPRQAVLPRRRAGRRTA